MPNPNEYRIGAEVKVTGAFTDPASGNPIDPATVRVTVTDPADVKTTKEYVTDPEVTQESPGNYALLVDANLPGRWHYYWHSLGAGKAAEEGTFLVRQAEALK